MKRLENIYRIISWTKDFCTLKSCVFCIKISKHLKLFGNKILGGIMLELVVAFDENRLIGKGNELPWHISEDLKHFKKLTSGNRIIMGRVTYESIGKPLPNRENIVLSRGKFEVEGVRTFNSVDELIAKLDDEKRNFIIGGSKVYETLLPYVDVLHISHVKGAYEGDVYFPKLNLTEWIIVEKIDFEEFEYIVYRKK